MTLAAKAIPQPPRTPIVGHAFAVDRNAPIAALNALAKQLGPIFQLDVMGATVVFIASAKLASEVWDETRFDKAVRGPLARVRAIGGDGLFTAKTAEPNWAKAHNILLAPFGNRAMQSYHAAMVDIAEQLCKKWERLNPDEEIEVVHDMTALTLDTIGLCGFDYRFNSFYRRDYHPFVEALVRSLETIMLHRGLPTDKLALYARRKTMAADLAFMNDIVDELVRERRGAAEARAKKDLLNAMLSGVDKQTGTQLDDLNIRYQINTFLIAGHETTSGLLSYAIFALLKNPDVLEKARAEADRVFGASEAPTYAQVTQLHYINQVLKESLRLWPPAPAVGLYPLKDETIGGYQIPKGRTVNVLIGPLQRDPEVWGPRADVFDPENFAPEAEAKRLAFAFKPFGNGQRACIGRGFAMHEAALALGMILRRFDLVDLHRYQLKLKETLTVKPEGFRIKARRRAEADRPRAVSAAVSPVAPPLAPAVRPTHNTPLLTLYGSNLGTAEEYARRLAETAEVNGFVTTLGALDDHVGPPPKEGGLVVFCASYNGAPPDNASKFVAWLRDEAPADAFAGVKYVVFGCGNSDWTATYQSVPRYLDERIASLGGARIAARGEGDARGDLDGQYEAWFSGLRPAAARAFSLQAGLDRETRSEPLYRMETIQPEIDNAAVAATGGRRMRVVENRELLAAKDRSTRHIEIELPEDQNYRPGDHLAVAPRNDAALVAAIAARFGLTPETSIRLEATPGRRPVLPTGVVLSIAKLLTDYVELQQPATRKQIAILAEHTHCPVTRPKLEALARDEGAYPTEVYAKRLSLFDLLRLYSAIELPLAAYLEMLPPLQPRYYSISCAPLADKGRVSVTVGVVQGSARSGRGDYRGVASNYLSGRKPGDFLHAAVRETKAGFRLPENPGTPLVMIGPGTGLAPFRGFLRERAALRGQGATLGRAMLFFGCRRADEDFLYADELKRFARDGLVDLQVAFSRPPDSGRTYVQDLMRREADALWRLLEAGAIVYVCGDGARMEPDVRRALVEIHAAKTGASIEESQAWIVRLGEDNQYVLDVWSNA